MAGPNNPDFSLESKKKIATATRLVLGEPDDYTNSTRPAFPRSGGGVLTLAKLTSRDGTDTSLYAWAEARRVSGGGWELRPSGRTGTTTTRPAVYLPTPDASDLTNRYVMLTGGSMIVPGDDTADPPIPDTLKPCMFIVGEFESIPQYPGDFKQGITTNTIGYGPAKARNIT